MTLPLSHLGDMPVEQFLAEYWQKKPLLIRQAFAHFQSPISMDELGGLSLEQDIESRIVLEQGNNGPWELLHGPFDENSFEQLPDTPWTLLVQAVDQLVPEVAELLNHFRFLPSWRLDDVMISYATDQGSVGPHFDYYDVFLLQAEGQRRWQVGPKVPADAPRVPGTALNILSDFQVHNDWLLEPGDMLYLPPQYAHWGKAQGECMTYSFGFRAPSIGNILEDLAAEVAGQLPEDLRYADPDTRPARHCDEITPDAIARVQQAILDYLSQPQTIGQWFGKVVTEPKYCFDAPPEQPRIQALIEDNPSLELIRDPGSRLAFFRMDKETGQAWLFADGEQFSTTLDVAIIVCENQTLSPLVFPQLFSDHETLQLLQQLLDQGSLIIN